MKKKVVLLILVDGLRHDYINPLDSPFIYSLSELNIQGPVRETFAFELRPAFFAGLYPEECGIANMYYYNPDESPFNEINTGDNNRERISKELREEAEKRGFSLVKYSGSCSEIPLSLIKYFDFSEKYKTSEPSALGKNKTIFDYLRENGEKWVWIGYPDGPGTTQDVLDEFNRSIADDIGFIYLHFSELDWAGHQDGPHSQNQKKVLRGIDEAIKEVYKKLNQIYSQVKGIIFGDHGQVEVRKNIDIETMLKETDLILEKDYIYFLDSTQARFWFFNDIAKKKVVELISTISEGKILTEADYERLHFRFKDNRFGNLIFVVNEGIGIFPNFFQSSKPYKGLHGYLPEVKDNWAKLIITGCGINKHFDQALEMVDIFPTMLEMQDYKIQNSLEAKSVFNIIDSKRVQNRNKVSLVMPTYNRLEILKKCISAVEDQTYPKDDFELVVVDDGSTDGTQDFLEDYKKLTKLKIKFFKQDNSGPASARNKAIINSDGHIIVLIGDDMLMEPDFIQNHLKFHQNWPQLSHACLGLIEWPKDIEINPFMEFITKEGGHQFNYQQINNLDPDNLGYEFFWSSNISFKKLFCLTHGLFNEKIFKHAMWEDIELGFRLKEAGLVIHFREDCKAYHNHKITFKKFAERQRMIGWYSHDVSDLGLTLGYSCSEQEKRKWFSKKALEDIADAIEEFERNLSDDKISELKTIYNTVLYYAAIVGYEERNRNLKEDVGGIISLLYNISLVESELAEKEKRLIEKDEKIKQLQSFVDKVKNTLVYKIYKKFQFLKNNN